MIPKTCPVGRLHELRAHPDAERVGVTYPRSLAADARLTLYKSRKALLAFCLPDSAHHALVKDAVHPTMLVNRNTQRPDAACAVLVASTGEPT